jgi:hypothetical protein
MEDKQGSVSKRKLVEPKGVLGARFVILSKEGLQKLFGLTNIFMVFMSIMNPVLPVSKSAITRRYARRRLYTFGFRSTEGKTKKSGESKKGCCERF